MFLSTISVKRPVLAGVLSAAILVVGAISLLRLETRQYPAIDPPVVSIVTAYRGASAPVVDAEITKRLLDRLSGIEGIRTIQSTSGDGQSNINIEFELSRDLDLAAADVRDQINRARDDLPDDANEPEVRKASSDASPIMWLSLTSDRLSNLELTDYASRQLAERLSLIDGVTRVRIGGERRFAIRVWLDRNAMAARGITVDDVAQRLEAENLELPAGRIESRLREFSVRTPARLTDPDEFARLVIRRDDGGRVRLADVARVALEAEDDRSGFSVNLRSAVSLGIVRQSNANTVEVADAIRAELDLIRPTLPDGVDLEISSDDSLFIRASIFEVVRTLGIALGLVVLVILLFLRSVRATLVPALTIPVSLIGTALVLYVLGFSINVLTLLAAVLAIGLVVDDAIVVLENIERRVRSGEPPLAAAVRGAGEVGFAVITTTVVLVAVFVPIAFLTGTVGRLFAEFGLTLAAAVVFSSFTALTLGAMLSSQLLKAKQRRRTPIGRFAGRVSGAIGSGLMAAYGWAVSLTIRLRWLAVVVIIAVSGAAYTLFDRLPQELTPSEDQGRFIISVDAPEGASLEYTLDQVRRIEEMLDEYRGNGGPITRIITIVAPGWGSAASVNTARIIVRLTDWSERDVTQAELVRQLRPRLAALPGVRATPINPPGLGIRGAAQPIQYAIGGPDQETAQRWAQRLLDEVRDDPHFVDLRLDFEQTRPQITVHVDRERAIDLGIDIATIGRSLQTFLGGREVTEFLDRGELYKVILQASPADRADPADLSGIYVRSSAGQLIPLSSIVTLTEAGTVRDLRRINRVPSIVMVGSVAEGSSLGAALDRLDTVVQERLPAGVVINYLGESLDYRESSLQLYIMFAMALALVYLALAAQFESLVHPITILVAVPLAVTGGLGALLLSGFSLNIYSQIGLILLIGLMTKNGILMVEFANQLQRRGMDVREAAVEAAKIRLRPILMTAISTVLGALPLVLAFGAGAEGRRAIGTVIFGGMAFSTLLTLFLIPALYTLLGRVARPSGWTERRADGQLRETMQPAESSDREQRTRRRTPQPVPAS